MYKSVLNNGLKIITHYMPGMQSVSLGIWVKLGSRYESGNFRGIAHFLEHLVFKGSEKYTCEQIKESIEGVGGALNAFTSEDVTCYYAKLPASRQLLALDILTDMALNPLLDEESIEKERLVILEEIKMHRDLPQSYIYDVLGEILWPGHPLGASVIGYRKTVLGIKRDDIAVFHNRFYVPSNIVITCCGNLDHQKILKALRMKSGNSVSREENKFIPAIGYEKKPNIKIVRKNNAQAHLALGFYGLNREHRDRYVCALLHIILGANMSSRLFNELREKRGLAYAVGTSIKGFSETGVFLVRAGIDSGKLCEVVDLVVKELVKIKKKKVLLSELNRAKEYYIGQLRLALEDTLERMFWFGEPIVQSGKTYKVDETIKNVRKITDDDIKRLAASLFKPQAARLAVISPRNEDKQKKKLYASIRKL